MLTKPVETPEDERLHFHWECKFNSMAPAKMWLQRVAFFRLDGLLFEVFIQQTPLGPMPQVLNPTPDQMVGRLFYLAAEHAEEAKTKMLAALKDCQEMEPPATGTEEPPNLLLQGEELDKFCEGLTPQFFFRKYKPK